MRLHPYQEVAVQHLHRHPRAGLFLDMGLGKTAITLRALTPDHLPALVVAPKRVAENVWHVEAAKWRPDLRVALAVGRPDQRAKALDDPRADVIVIGRDNLADVGTRRFQTFILDELSGFKSRGSKRWRAAKRISASSDYVWGLTGTPSPNGLMDLWAQMYILDGGERLGTTLTGFRNRYFSPGYQLPNGVIASWDLRPESESAIHRKIDDICISMTSDGLIDLPPVTHNSVEVPMTPQTRALYRKMKDDLVVDLEILGGEVHTVATAAILSSKLSQISAGFMYVDDADIRGQLYDVIHHDKVRAVQEIVDGTGSPVLVFYRFKAEEEMLTEALKDLVHKIDEPDAIERWNAGQIPVLLAHPSSAGHGLNLQHGGHTVVWTSLPWSLEEWEQGNKRVARQGQTDPVIIHTLVTPRTVDGAIRKRLDGKASVQEALMEHLESPL